MVLPVLALCNKLPRRQSPVRMAPDDGSILERHLQLSTQVTVFSLTARNMLVSSGTFPNNLGQGNNVLCFKY